MLLDIQVRHFDRRGKERTSPRRAWLLVNLDALSTQTDGHFFSLQLAYDRLAATEHEKLRVARLLCNMVLNSD